MQQCPLSSNTDKRRAASATPPSPSSPSSDSENTPPPPTAAWGVSRRLSNVIFCKLRTGVKKNSAKKAKAGDDASAAAPECRTQSAIRARLDVSFDQLMKIVTQKSDENALSPDEECLICVTRRACVQSYPCGHKVLCEKCFVKLLQLNYCEGKYPVTCIFCRGPVALYRRQDPPNVVIRKYIDSPCSRLYHSTSASAADTLKPYSSSLLSATTIGNSRSSGSKNQQAI